MTPSRGPAPFTTHSRFRRGRRITHPIRVLYRVTFCVTRSLSPEMEVIFSVSCASISVTQKIDVPVKSLHVLPAEWSTMKCLAHTLKLKTPVRSVSRFESENVGNLCCPAVVKIFGWNVKVSLNDALTAWEQKAFPFIHLFLKCLWTIIHRQNH